MRLGIISDTHDLLRPEVFDFQRVIDQVGLEIELAKRWDGGPGA